MYIAMGFEYSYLIFRVTIFNHLHIWRERTHRPMFCRKCRGPLVRITLLEDTLTIYRKGITDELRMDKVSSYNIDSYAFGTSTLS
jgi:hypothetical protein